MKKVYVLGTETTWPSLLSFYVILVILCSIAFPFLPESPKYLYVVKKQPKRAIIGKVVLYKQLTVTFAFFKIVLEKLRLMKACDMEGEINELEIEFQDNEKKVTKAVTFWQVLSDRTLLLPLLLVCSMQAGQQFSGINAVSKTTIFFLIPNNLLSS